MAAIFKANLGKIKDMASAKWKFQKAEVKRLLKVNGNSTSLKVMEKSFMPMVMCIKEWSRMVNLMVKVL